MTNNSKIKKYLQVNIAVILATIFVQNFKKKLWII